MYTTSNEVTIMKVKNGEIKYVEHSPFTFPLNARVDTTSLHHSMHDGAVTNGPTQLLLVGLLPDKDKGFLVWAGLKFIHDYFSSTSLWKIFLSASTNPLVFSRVYFLPFFLVCPHLQC